MKRCNTQTSACIRNRLSVLGFQYKGQHFKRKTCIGKNHIFNQKSHIFGIFKKSALDFNETAVANQSPLQILGLFLFVNLRKHLAENANKNYHVYKVIFVRHIYNLMFGIRLSCKEKLMFDPYQIDKYIYFG